MLTMLDDTWDLARSWFLHMHDDGARVKLQEAILEILPDPDGAKPDVHAAANALEEMKQSNMYHFCSQVGQSDLNIIFQWVKALAQQRQPAFKDGGCKFLGVCKDTLGRSLFAQPPAAAASGTA